MAKKIYKVEGMDCSSCALLIEANLEDLGAKASCNYAKGSLEVEYDENKVTEAQIQESVKRDGYTLTSKSQVRTLPLGKSPS